MGNFFVFVRAHRRRRSVIRAQDGADIEANEHVISCQRTIVMNIVQLYKDDKWDSEWNSYTDDPTWRGSLGQHDFSSWDLSVDTVSGLIAELNLSKYDIHGDILQNLCVITSLKKLCLQKNRIFGIIPNEIGKLTALEMLFLDRNLLSGKIPKTLGSLVHLDMLDLCHNQLNGEIPPEIGLLSNLRILELSNNRLTGSIPKEFGFLRSLQQIRVANNLLECDEWGFPPEIFNLMIFYNLKITDVSGNSGLRGSIPEAVLTQPNLALLTEGTQMIYSETYISLEVPQFLLHVVPREKLLQMNRLLTHEQAGVYCDEILPTNLNWRTNGLIEVLTPSRESWQSAMQRNSSTSAFPEYYHFTNWTGLARQGLFVSREQIVFISHRWLSKPGEPPHPDDADNTKLRHLQNIARAHPEWSYFWIDVLCIPQEDRTQQKWAINSLPHYVKCCGALITLCGQEGESCLCVYKSRGWCRMEQLSSMIIVQDGTGNDCETQLYIANRVTESFERMSNLVLNELNPLLGSFTDDMKENLQPKDRDRARVLTCLQFICKYLVKSSDPTLRQLAVSIVNSPCYLFNCPGGHGLKPPVAIDNQPCELCARRNCGQKILNTRQCGVEYVCSNCGNTGIRTKYVFGCLQCEYEICSACVNRAADGAVL